MSTLKELVTIAAKVAADGATKGKGLLKDVLSSTAAVTAGEVVEKAAKKAGLMRTNMHGDLVLKVPFFKTTEDKIEKAFAEHPDRQKVCFHFGRSIREGVDFFDPDGNKVFEIREDKKNLKHIELYQGVKYVGRIDKHPTFNFNPLKEVQKYDAMVHNSSGIVKIVNLDVSIDLSEWLMKHKFGGNYIIQDNNGEEIGKVYSLGFFNFVMDYEDSLDPVELILSFMAVKIRIEELRENHRHGYKGGSMIVDMIDDLRDIF